MYIDIHAHILPSVDDGAKSTEEALQLLRMLKSQNTRAVSLSPHFYPATETSLEEYKSRINSSFEKLKAAKSDDLPELYLGSEVHYFNGISTFSEIDKLCMGNSHYILVELPYRAITARTLNEITELNLNRGLGVILAHIERYRRFDGYDALLKLISDGFAIGQVNAYSFLHMRTRRKALSLVKEGYVGLIASDCHSAEHNPPRIEEAISVIRKKLGNSYVHKLQVCSEKLYEEIKGILE